MPWLPWQMQAQLRVHVPGGWYFLKRAREQRFYFPGKSWARLPGHSLPWGDEADGPLRPRLNHSSGLELWLELWPLTCHLAPHTSLIQLLALILGPSRHLLRGCHAQMQFPPVDPHPGAPRHANRGQLIPFMQDCTDFSCGTGMLFSCSSSLHI